jgi:uncharacterized protein (DUF2062 family)
MALWRDLIDRGRALLVQAKNEHSSPREVGFAVATGVFSACTPFLGFHMWIALALATVFRLNRLWAFLGSRISIVPVFLLISFCEIELGHRLRKGKWVAMSVHDALAHGRELGVDWALGTVLVGVALAAAVGLAAYGVARGWTKVTLRTPDAPLRPSSESPPSAPRGSMP